MNEQTAIEGLPAFAQLLSELSDYFDASQIGFGGFLVVALQFLWKRVKPASKTPTRRV